MSTETPGSSKGVALVTGSGQGIGRSIALRLANDGYDVGLNDLDANKNKLEVLSEEITRLCPGRRVCVLVADVSIEGEVKDMVDGVVAALGRLDVMVANAGVLRVKTILESKIFHTDSIVAH
ncbi:hypothetical protein J3R82DRAFT_7353 [Butyriboletus roseoflavus]|nr:hypothetical protein J3R82DRAFT_7353 [Butyriboletus roseoflavus]